MPLSGDHKPLGVAEAERLVRKILSDDKELRFILHAMDKLGCPVPEGKFFQVRDCSQSVSGGYYPPEGVSCTTPRVFLSSPQALLPPQSRSSYAPTTWQEKRTSGPSCGTR